MKKFLTTNLILFIILFSFSLAQSADPEQISLDSGKSIGFIVAPLSYHTFATGYSITAVPSPLSVGVSVTELVTVTLLNNDAPVDAATINAVSSDELVALLLASQGTTAANGQAQFNIQGLKNGTAQITFTATVSGDPFSVSGTDDVIVGTGGTTTTTTTSTTSTTSTSTSTSTSSSTSSTATSTTTSTTTTTTTTSTSTTTTTNTTTSTTTSTTVSSTITTGTTTTTTSSSSTTTTTTTTSTTTTTIGAIKVLKITASPKPVKLSPDNNTVSLEVTVTGKKNVAVPGVIVTAVLNKGAAKVAVLTSETETTDSSGKATFEISKIGEQKGAGSVTIKADKKKINVAITVKK